MIVAGYAPPVPDSPDLSLHRRLESSTLTLRKGVESWTFSSAIEAMRFAATLIKVETKLTVYSEEGKLLLVTSVYPA
jgi:hypothetical protein